MRPKLPSAGLKRGASLPPASQKGRDHTEAVKVLLDVFQAPPGPNGRLDLDLLDLESQAMAAAGCPINLLPPRIHHSSMDGGDPFPAGRKI